MPITFDEVTADLTPPSAPPPAPDHAESSAVRETIDASVLGRELQRLADRAARLSAD